LRRSDPLEESEADFQKAVIELAQLLGWRVAHFRPARTEHGWRTAVSADGKGFVDLVMVKTSVLFVELKAERGRVSPEQEAWHAALRAAGAEVYVWKPPDWTVIEARLRRG
jgi:hypothetical protein